MTIANRRSVLQLTAAMGAGALTGAASAATPPAAEKPMFDVPRAFIPIVGSDAVFPVRRIYCIGRNYAAHAIERGSDPTREPPFFFQKPTDAIQNVKVGEVADHPYPSLTKNYHHEVELVAALKSGGTNIAPDQALQHVYGYALGLDMTRRDLQNGMSAEKKPWEIGKSFDHGAVIGPIHPVAKTGHFAKGGISLAVNGTVRQTSDLDKMIWSVAGRRHVGARMPKNQAPRNPATGQRHSATNVAEPSTSTGSAQGSAAPRRGGAVISPYSNTCGCGQKVRPIYRVTASNWVSPCPTHIALSDK